MTRTTSPAALPGPEGFFMTDDTSTERIGVLFGRRLRAARFEAGMSSQEVALQARTTVRHLEQIESGTSSPDLDLIGRLAHILGCEAYELLPDRAEAASSRPTAIRNLPRRHSG
jgi:transcriptional regulator with XRE-family HTH domain